MSTDTPTTTEARAELRDLLANVQAARTMYGDGAYARGLAVSLLPAINAAAERAGMIRTDHAERERLQLDSSGPMRRTWMGVDA